jgi:type II secretion system protein G
VINKSAGFTLLELLVVIAIVGLLSAVVFGSLSESKDKAKEVVALKEVRRLNEAIFMYELDTSTKLECSTGVICTDKLTTNPGISGWDGPYFESNQHPWGGQLIILNRRIGAASLGETPETLIYLSNDRPGFGISDNRAIIPMSSMLNIDKILDDGNLMTGSVRRMPDVSRAEENQLLIRPEI